jgi:dTDP-4-amino-4,6-dideoxygalactose transaminase
MTGFSDDEKANRISRRSLLGAAPLAAASGAGLALAQTAVDTGKPALLGGSPVKSNAFPGWPVEDPLDENALSAVVRSGEWGRGTGKKVLKFEQQFATLMSAPHCLATSSGTAALFTALNVMGIGPGDEVLVPPYTFVACVNVILMCHALPVFVDTDPETFQIDARKIEAAITGRTRAILAVHLGGATFDVDAVRAVAKKHNLPLLEDSCQSHLAEWRGHRTGAFGTAGCFSFQASKNLNAGEGGAILTASEEFRDRCFAFHNNSRGSGHNGDDFTYAHCGLNLRMTEFQAALLSTQMTRLEAQSKKRTENALYLTGMLSEIPGIRPARMYEGCTRNAYHLYMLRYDAERFGGLPRPAFLKALRAEGIPGAQGYTPLNKEPFLENTLAKPGFQRIYGRERLAAWKENNHCPANDRLCEEAVWFTQNMLLGPRRDMDEIAAAVRKIQRHAGDLRKS